MGCDIHDYAEVRTDGHWRPYPGMVPNKYYQPGDKHEKPERLAGFDATGGRNYAAFAILGNVRNDPTYGDPLAFLQDCRGIPKDASREVQGEHKRWGADAHSAGWLSAREMVEFDWSRRVGNRGFISIAAYAGWRTYDRDEGRPPREYSGDIFGRDIRKCSMEVADGLLDDALRLDRAGFMAWRAARPDPFSGERPDAETPAGLRRVYVDARWDAYYTEAAGRLYTVGVPQLARLAREHAVSLDDVRLVFWFDN